MNLYRINCKTLFTIKWKFIIMFATIISKMLKKLNSKGLFSMNRPSSHVELFHAKVQCLNLSKKNFFQQKENFNKKVGIWNLKTSFAWLVWFTLTGQGGALKVTNWNHSYLILKKSKVSSYTLKSQGNLSFE